jgi:mitogen-activated protein kinase kinase
MLLDHAWLAPLVKPETIVEEDEEAAEISAATEKLELSTEANSDAATDTSVSVPQLSLPSDVVDKEVADWVIGAMERRRSGRMGKSTRPPLHTAPLDAVPSPAA